MLCGLFSSCDQNDRSSRVLVFSKTKGYYHESIPSGISAIQKLGAENSFDVDTTKDATFFTSDTLKKYKAIIFLSTTGDVLNSDQQVALEGYMKAGGGFVGVHAAADTEYEWRGITNLLERISKAIPIIPMCAKL